MEEFLEQNFEDLLSRSQIWDENQLSLRNEAHQRATLQCDAPAVVWHAAAWPERKVDPQNSHTIREHNERLQDWLDRVNGLLEALGGDQYFYVDDGISASQTTDILDRIERKISRNNWIKSVKPKGIEFTTPWRDVLVQVRAQLFTDFISVTFLIKIDDDFDIDQVCNRQTILEYIRLHTSQAAAPDKARESADFLFVEVWDLFTSDLLVSTRTKKQVMNAEELLRSLVPGKLFLSLRGVILDASTDIGWINKEEYQYEEKSSVSEGISSERGKKTKESGLDAQQVLRKYEHFITNGGFDDDDRDFVAASILHDRAIFVSPFGAKSSNDPKDKPESTTPRRVTRFTILTKGKTNQHEMGRVVANVTTLCTLQIAAIKDINLIRQVGTQIRLAGDRLNEFSIRFSKAIERLGRPPRNLEVKLCKFETELDELSRLPTGGLPYRVYRSRYYAREFKRRLASLKFGSLDNWQSPETFFEKRLFAVFDYINNVGQRMRNLRSRLYETLEAVQTKTLVDLTSRVHKIHRTGQLQSLILFVIAVSAFCGEIFEPLFQVGRNHPEFFRQALGLFGANGLIFQVPEAYQQCLPLEPAAQSALRADIDIFSSNASEGSEGSVCKPVYRVLGYSYGLVVALSMAFLYMIFAPVWRGAVRFLVGASVDTWERIRLRL